MQVLNPTTVNKQGGGHKEDAVRVGGGWLSLHREAVAVAATGCHIVWKRREEVVAWGSGLMRATRCLQDKIKGEGKSCDITGMRLCVPGWKTDEADTGGCLRKTCKCARQHASARVTRKFLEASGAARHRKRAVTGHWDGQNMT